jgi:cytochrome c oxidase assembly factor CtaG
VPSDPFAWSWHPEAVLATALLAATYAAALRRFPAPRWRVVAFAGGIALLVATSVTPLDALSYHLLSAHLLQNVVLAEWAPLLLVAGVPPALAAALGRVPAVRALVHPLVALPIWVATYFVWHLPPAYDTALEHGVLLHLEHASYLAAGCLLWWPVLQTEPRRIGWGARAVYVLGAFLLASPVGLLLALLPEPIYDWYADGFERWDLSALSDQQIAGVIMAGAETVVFFTVFAYAFFRFLGEEEARGDRGDTQVTISGRARG